MSWKLSNIHCKEGKIENVLCCIGENDIWVEYSKQERFQNDVIFSDNDDNYILIQGVIFNIEEVKKNIRSSLSLSQVFFCVSKIRGIFSGIIIDKKKRNSLCFW